MRLLLVPSDSGPIPVKGFVAKLEILGRKHKCFIQVGVTTMALNVLDYRSGYIIVRYHNEMSRLAYRQKPTSKSTRRKAAQQALDASMHYILDQQHFFWSQIDDAPELNK